MKFIPLLAATLAVSVAVRALAQAPISAPSGWSLQKRDNGATTFSPPDLQAGEVYSVTLYDSARLEGKTPEEYLRAFAGTVGTKPGQLTMPLRIEQGQAGVVVGGGIYSGPNGKSLGTAFVGTSLDGASIHMMRTLVSEHEELQARYKEANSALMSAMMERAASEAGRNIVRVPPIVAQKMKPGGDLVPGIYVGNQFRNQELQHRLRLYLYPSGEYGFKNENDVGFVTKWGIESGVGTRSYNRATGQLNLGSAFSLQNARFTGSTDFCFYGRNSEGKPTIYGEKEVGYTTTRTSLVWVAPLAKSASPSAIKARQDKEKARADAIQAEKDRFKWVVAPGKGVKTAQIEAVLLETKMVGTIVSRELYLLLRDKTIYKGLPVAPDQLDVATSRQKEPGSWGRWTRAGKEYRVTWKGKPGEDLPALPVFPGTPKMRLQGRYEAARAGFNWYQIWGVAFDKAGRFAKHSRGGAGGSTIATPDGPPVATTTWDEGGTATTVTGGGVGATMIRPKNPNADREGTYSIDGYTITLRYDSGRVVRLPFFFTSADRKSLWFENGTLDLG